VILSEGKLGIQVSFHQSAEKNGLLLWHEQVSYRWAELRGLSKAIKLSSGFDRYHVSSETVSERSKRLQVSLASVTVKSTGCSDILYPAATQLAMTGHEDPKVCLDTIISAMKGSSGVSDPVSFLH
jgi:hypothetical protein